MRKWVVLWLASMVVVAGLASALTRAQGLQNDSRVVSGADIGFRVEGVNRAGTPSGTLVIRVKGEWVPVDFGRDVRPAY
jgi:hypothetical protein